MPDLPPNFDVKTASPRDYFLLFITDELMDVFVENTKGYAKWCEAQKCLTDPLYTDKLWNHEVTKPEPDAFLEY